MSGEMNITALLGMGPVPFWLLVHWSSIGGRPETLDSLLGYALPHIKSEATLKKHLRPLQAAGIVRPVGHCFIQLAQIIGGNIGGVSVINPAPPEKIFSGQARLPGVPVNGDFEEKIVPMYQKEKKFLSSSSSNTVNLILSSNKTNYSSKNFSDRERAALDIVKSLGITAHAGFRDAVRDDERITGDYVHRLAWGLILTEGKKMPGDAGLLLYRIKAGAPAPEICRCAGCLAERIATEAQPADPDELLPARSVEDSWCNFCLPPAGTKHRRDCEVLRDEYRERVLARQKGEAGK